jgi:alkanesulfonate monooxygenase SsuD/methylene tetrahydromethanopterin reductase-like flavin-dependent oxidoreductase (luciferase family)
MPKGRPPISKRSRGRFRIGYQLSSEEHRPNDLVKYAQMAEQHGFSFANISDHFHPWTDTQGQSPFVWAVIGGIAHATERLELGTWVTCPDHAACIRPLSPTPPPPRRR